ncbi:MAG: hypothetical protein OXL97_10920 [Chloroflexota bacterium]|nr:hypothetical protein [Chloroflexota bacterium]MDE2884988.1 hypothetical protein [Chloroflexota bacterium]
MTTQTEEPIGEEAPPSERYAKHRARADSLLAHADAILQRDVLTAADRLQVSEKIWGAVTHTLKAIAASQGWVFRRPRAADSMKSYLGRLSQDGDINVLFRAVSDYHTNFYQDHVPGDDMRHGVDAARALRDKLWSAADLIPQEASPPT